jgi:SAM-dependent methyltransferase
MSVPRDPARAFLAMVWDGIGDSYGSVIPMLVEFAELLVDAANLQPGERVIDLGTGNGHGLIPAAKAVTPATVVGVDISTEMLKAARRRVDAAELANVDLRTMDVSRLEFADASFDVAIASTVFQFVGYSPDALVEWRRVLVPGGRLLLSLPVPGHTMGPLDDLMRDFFVRQPQPIQDAWTASGRLPWGTTLPNLMELCGATGFGSAQVEEHERTYTFANFDAWWDFQWTHGSRAFLVTLPDDAVVDMKREAESRLAATAMPTGEIPITFRSQICRAIA